MLITECTPANVRSFLHDTDAFEREFNRFFNGITFDSEDVYPAVNAYRDSDGITLKAELPGIDPKSLDVSVEGDELTLRGKAAENGHGENVAWRRRERRHVDFARTVKLPFRADPKGIEASFSKGILTVDIKTPEEQKPRTIDVKSV